MLADIDCNDPDRTNPPSPLAAVLFGGSLRIKNRQDRSSQMGSIHNRFHLIISSEVGRVCLRIVVKSDNF